MAEIILPLAVAFAAAFVATPIVRRFARAASLVANPVADRWHKQPTPMMGGVAVFIGFMSAVALAAGVRGFDIAMLQANMGLMGIVAASTLMFFVGLVDDKFKLRPATKLIGQVLAAAIVVSAGVVYPVTPWALVNVLVTIFWFIGVTNALNLLDNMDGVAAGVAAVAIAFLGVTFALEGVIGLAAVCFALAGALLGFLPYNFHPASIFMGDSGSLFIGSLLAGLGAAYPSKAPASIVSVLFVPAIIVIIPILDTLLVTVARTLAGRSISVGGRDHSTHRLASMGLSQRQVALLLYGFAACGGVLALVLRGTPAAIGIPIAVIFLVGMLVAAAYLSGLHSYEAMNDKPSPKVTVLVADLLHKRRAFEVLMDLLMFAAAYQFAYLLRWDASLPPDQAAIFVRTLGLAVVAQSISFGAFSVYRGHWHHLSVTDVPRIAAAAVVGSLLLLAMLVMMYPSGGYARSIFFIFAMLVALLTMGARLAFRLLGSIRRPTGAPALIYGAGRGGELAVREMLSNHELSLRPVGFLDDDAGKRRRRILGFPVLGGFDLLDELVAQYGVRTVVIGVRRPEPEALARLQSKCEQLGVDLLHLQLEFHLMTPPRGDVIAFPGRSSQRAL